MRRRRHRVIVTLVLVGITIAASDAYTQTLAEIQGVVDNESGAPLAGVTVVVRETRTGAERTVVTDAGGRYKVKALASGTYAVTASREGLRTAERRSIPLLTGQLLDVNLAMVAGTLAEDIAVTTEPPLVEPRRSSVASYVDEVTIQSFPILGRDFKQYVVLTPAALPEPVRGFLTIAGERGIYSAMDIDGANAKSAFFAYGRGGEATENDGIVVAQDSVKEMRVVASASAPEHGSSGGAYINVITKSGTNRLRGSTFYLFTQDSLKDDIPSSPLDDFRGIDGSRPVDDFERQNFGLSLGGPIKRDKTHFFLAYDRTERDMPFTDDLRTRGAYDAILEKATTTGNSNWLSFIEGYEPNDDGLPLPDGTFGRTATGLFLRSVENEVLLLRADHRFSAAQSFSLRWNHTDFLFQSTWKDEESEKAEETNSVVAQLVSVIGDRAVNEARLQWADDNLDRLSKRVGEPFEFRIVFRSFSEGADSLGKLDALPIFVEERKLQFQDYFSYALGRHDLKFGADYQSDKVQQLFAASRDGRYDYRNVQAFRDDQVIAARIYFGDVTFPNYDEAQDTLALFAQDSWQPNARLTLNYGLRYGATYNPGGLEHAFADGLDIPDDTDNWAPRFGFAYSPGRDARQVVRGGVGLFHGRTPSILFAGQVQENGIFPKYGRQVVRPGDPGYVPPGEPIDNQSPPPDCRFAAPGERCIRPATSYVDTDFEDAETWRMNLGYERQLGADWAASADLIYAESEGLPTNIDVNRTLVGHDEFGRPLYAGDDRPDPDFQSILTHQSVARSEYRGLSVKLSKRYARGYSLQTHYTWSKDEDTDSNERSTSMVFVQDLSDVMYDWGPSQRDVRNRFVVSGVVDLPYGFQLSGGYLYSSGPPWTAVDEGFNVQNFPGNGFGDLAARAIVDGGVVGRNRERHDSTNVVNLRVSKYFSFDRYELDLFFEAFNLFNEVAFAVVGSQRNPWLDTVAGIPNPEYKIPDRQLIDQRQYQWGVRLSY